MGISVSGLTDGGLLQWDEKAKRLNAQYKKLQEKFSVDGVIKSKIKMMRDHYADAYLKFDQGYYSEGETKASIKGVLEEIDSEIETLEKETSKMYEECRTRADFYNRLHNNIIAKRNEVANKYQDKEYKGDWRLIENTVIAAHNNSNAEKRANIRYSINGCTVSYS